MKQRILKIISNIKESLKDIDNGITTNQLLDDIYESLNQIEDEIYSDDTDAFREDEDY